MAGPESEPELQPGEESLERLRTTDPVQYLSPSPEISRLVRTVFGYHYSSLVPYCSSKPPLEEILCDENFDAEQIWGQIEALDRMIWPGLKRQVDVFEKETAFVGKSRGKVVSKDDFESQEEEEEENSEELGEGESDEDDSEEERDEEEDEEEEEEEEDEEEDGERKMVEDKFLKIKELEKFLEQGEAEEYGELPVEKNKSKRNKNNEDESGGEEDDEDEDDEEGFTFGDVGDDDDDGGEEADQAEYLKYEDFWGGKANRASEKKSSKKKVHFEDEEELQDIELEEQENDDTNKNDKKNLSTHEKEKKKLESQIEQMEKANMEPKTWTMQGEVTAAKRPKNSALEVDLDFEHNTRPVPVITEDVTASLEEIIKQRIIDGKFDDVERAPVLPTKAPKELKEMDETKSKKGLAELYEEDYAQKAGLTPAVLSATDALKKEADLLFKKICLKLDALSHFHFAPKPVIEDMSVQVNVPALAMEEIAPIAVSDAAMLAPEEIFEGKGDIKEDKELSQSERKRRRANKKRKFQANSENRTVKKPRETKEE